MSKLFRLTARKQGTSVARATLEFILNQNWDIFNRADDMPFSLVNSDGTKYNIFDGLGPPMPQIARQHQTIIT